MPAGELIEANCHARLIYSEQLLNVFFSFGSVIKSYRIYLSYTEKLAE